MTAAATGALCCAICISAGRTVIQRHQRAHRWLCRMSWRRGCHCSCCCVSRRGSVVDCGAQQAAGDDCECGYPQAQGRQHRDLRQHRRYAPAMGSVPSTILMRLMSAAPINRQPVQGSTLANDQGRVVTVCAVVRRCSTYLAHLAFQRWAPSQPLSWMICILCRCFEQSRSTL